jgi:transposase
LACRRDCTGRLINAAAVTRRVKRYPSDTTDEQWALIEPLLPQVNTGGRPEKHARREIVDAILYLVRGGCAWRQLPVDFPPWQTVYWYFVRWEQAKVTERILPVVRERLRVQEGRNPEPSAGLIDSQSVQGADTAGAGSRGHDADKKINGRKRFILTDTLGLLLVLTVRPAGVQDRDGAKPALLETYLRTRVRYVVADGAFAGKLCDWAVRLGHHDPAHHHSGRSQACRPARLRRHPTPLGSRAHLRPAHRPPPPGQRLRTSPRCLRGHDLLGRDQPHHPAHHPRRPRHPPTETHLHDNKSIFSNAL